MAPDDAAIDALAERALGDLLAAGRAELGALGTLWVRTFHAFSGRDPQTGLIVDVPARRFPFMRFSTPVRDFVGDGGARPPQLDGALGAFVERACAGEVSVLGRLGEVRVLRRDGATAVDPAHGELTVSPVSIITLRPSQQIRQLLDDQPAEMLPAGDIDRFLAATPLVLAPPTRDPDALIAFLAREHPQLAPCSDPDLRDEAQAEHELLCEILGKRPGIVFTRTASETEPRDTDHWALASNDADPLVFRTQGRDESPLRLSLFLGEHAFLAALRRAADGRFLSSPDWRRVVAHVDRTIAGFARRVHGLPF